MIDDRFEDILTHADRAAGSPALRPGLANRVLQKARRRRRNTRIACIGAAVLTAAVVVGQLRLNTRDNSEPAAPPPTVATATNQPVAAPSLETAQADDDISTRLKHIEEAIAALERQQQQLRTENALAALREPLDKIQQQREKAALILVFYADKKYNELDLKDSAVADYKQVIALFPDTTWAQKAREKLKTIQPQGEQL